MLGQERVVLTCRYGEQRYEEDADPLRGHITIRIVVVHGHCSLCGRCGGDSAGRT